MSDATQRGARGGGGESLLVADDDPFIARLLEIELAAAGYDVRVASDGAQALELAQERMPRPGPRRRDDAEHGRLRAHAPAPPGSAHRGRLDHHAHRARALRRQARGVRDRRGRLHRQAVRHAGAAGADPRRAPPRRRRCARSRRSPGCPGNVRIEEEIDGLRRARRGVRAALRATSTTSRRTTITTGSCAATGDPDHRGGCIEDGRAGGRPARTRSSGHVGGDDFVRRRAAREGRPTSPRPSSSASTGGRRTLYDPDDRERGYIEVANRRGELQRFPLLSISIGVASTEQRAFAHYAEAVADRDRDEDLTRRRPPARRGRSTAAPTERDRVRLSSGAGSAR